MAPLREGDDYRPTHKLLDLARLYFYDVRGIESIVTQKGPRPYVLRRKADDKYDLIMKWIGQDDFLKAHGASDYVSAPGDDGLVPQSEHWEKSQKRKMDATKKLCAAQAAGWTLKEAWDHEPKPAKGQKKTRKTRAKTVDDNSSDEESTTSAGDDVKVSKKLTVAQIKARLDRLGVPHRGVRNWQPLYDLLEQECRTRQKIQPKQDGDTRNDEEGGGWDMEVDSNPAPPKRDESVTTKRKRQDKDNGRLARKRAKADATKSFEIEGAENEGDISDDDDERMTDPDSDIGIEVPQRKKANASKQSAASKSATTGTASVGAKTHLLKQANLITNPGTNGDAGPGEAQAYPMDHGHNGLNYKDAGMQQEKDDGKVSRKRAKAGVADLLEVDVTGHGGKILDDEDVHMVDAHDQVGTAKSPPRKKAAAKSKPVDHAAASERDAASRSRRQSKTQKQGTTVNENTSTAAQPTSSRTTRNMARHANVGGREAAPTSHLRVSGTEIPQQAKGDASAEKDDDVVIVWFGTHEVIDCSLDNWFHPDVPLSHYNFAERCALEARWRKAEAAKNGREPSPPPKPKRRYHYSEHLNEDRLTAYRFDRNGNFTAEAAEAMRKHEEEKKAAASQATHKG